MRGPRRPARYAKGTQMIRLPSGLTIQPSSSLKPAGWFGNIDVGYCDSFHPSSQTSFAVEHCGRVLLSTDEKSILSVHCLSKVMELPYMAPYPKCGPYGLPSQRQEQCHQARKRDTGSRPRALYNDQKQLIEARPKEAQPKRQFARPRHEHTRNNNKHPRNRTAEHTGNTNRTQSVYRLERKQRSARTLNSPSGAF